MPLQRHPQGQILPGDQGRGEGDPLDAFDQPARNADLGPTIFRHRLTGPEGFRDKGRDKG